MDDERRGHGAGAQRGTMPGHVTVRHPTIADGPRTIELINAAETHDIGEPMLELSDIATDWLGPGVDLDRDVILVEEHERLVAWAQVNGDRGDADVHPDARGQGLGSGVLDWMEARVLARTPLDQAAVLGQTIPDGDVAARVLFQRRGYERRWTSWVLRLPSETQIRRPALPPGVDVRAVRPGEERAVHAVIDGAFSEWEGRDPRPFEDWQARVLRHAEFDPALLLVATCDDEIVGACFALHYPGDGWVDQIAVAPPHRGRGLATALLAEAFSIFRGRGETRMGLSTDSRTGALDLYLHLGMEVTQHFTNWARVLRPARPSTS